MSRSETEPDIDAEVTCERPSGCIEEDGGEWADVPAGAYEEASEVEPRGTPLAEDLIASLAFAARSSSSSLHFRAPGQCPSQDSSTARQLRASSNAA